MEIVSVVGKMASATMMDLSELHRGMIVSHSYYSRKPQKAFRKFDGVTPFWIHPSWCAMTILAEEKLSEEQRVRGAWALMLHDILEDTTHPLPSFLPDDVVALVQAMTYEGGFDEEKVKVWEHSPEVRLLKLYDKTSNMMDDSWQKPARRTETREYVSKLADDVEKNYGSLNIIKFARALLAAG